MAISIPLPLSHLGLCERPPVRPWLTGHLLLRRGADSCSASTSRRGYSSREAMHPCSRASLPSRLQTPRASPPRLDMLDASTTMVNAFDELEGQLKDFFLEIRMKLEMGNKDDAVCLLQANYEEVKEQIDSGSKGIEQAAILDIIAWGYMGVGDFESLENLLKMLNDILSNLHDGLPLMDSILTHIGSMYITLGKFDDAIHAHARGLEIVERKFGKNSAYLVTPLMGIAKALRLNGRASEAIVHYNRVVDVLKKTRGRESEELVLPLSALGDLFISEGKASEAEDCYRRIKKIYEKLYGRDNGRIGLAMCSLARAFCAKGNVNQAISEYEGGIQVIIDSKYLSLDDNLLNKLKVDLAELLHVAGREQEGRELLEECLMISERYKGMEHPTTVAHLLQIATSHSRSKNFAVAERLLRTCLNIMSKKAGSLDQSITVPMLHLAITLYNLKQYEKAETLAKEVVDIREHAFGKEALPVGEALDCLASIQIKLGKDDEDILGMLRRVLSIQEKEIGYESDETVATLKKVIFYLDKIGNRDEKLRLLRRLRLLKDKYQQSVAV